MATKAFAQSNEKIDNHVYAYKNILSAVGFVNLNTGETIKMSAEQKVVWFYILSQYKFFKDKDQPYFENQADIGLACDVSEKTVQRFIRVLEAGGYLQISQTRRFGGRKSNSYVLLSDLVLVQPDKALNTAAQAFPDESDTNAAPPPENGSKELIERYIENNSSAGEEWVTESIPFDDVPDWINDSLAEDDGSVADARDYVEARPIGNVNTAQIHYQPSSKPADEQRACKSNQASGRENNGYTLYEIKGELHTLENNHYVPASAIDISLFETGLPF